MKKIVVLGSTGSIGINTLDIIRRFPESFQVVGLAAGANHLLFTKQIKEFRPRVAAIFDKKAVAILAKKLKGLDTELLSGADGVIDVARHADADLVVSAIVGAAGLLPTLSAILANKTVALANKETMVMAGEIVQREAKAHKVDILPIDSEHAAIHQLLHTPLHPPGRKQREDVKKIILTASGGPLLRYTSRMQKSVTCEEALAHPTWKMGPKISIDSATLINKGFEMIEARWLFDLPPEKIDVVIHPQSIIHSLIEFTDRSMIAQMGLPDMRIPIAYALFYPDRKPLPFKSLDLTKLAKLTFEPPDKKGFPLLQMAVDVLAAGGTLPAVLNAANEEAVGAFLQKKIQFPDIHKIVRKVLDAHLPIAAKKIEEVLMADRWARWETGKIIVRATHASPLH
ncbi:MAG: 1-deoxy-D-xylulose-5-phosphate reductoisomerase [Nitrospirae bacterium]|nr:1-deoxy-D-xylulose-5-phosphate reductoisomerase [Candidatus Troglogloeales bacterium]